MMARAPGKLVVSGAYAVLGGAPAIVTAVDRYVTADTERRPPLLTPEVRAALGDRTAPGFDASALRDAQDQKLGLGSSAAILVASLAALELLDRGPLSDTALCAAVFELALTAHARAQGGGSGIDVAASAHGGTLLAQRRDGRLHVQREKLPTGLWCEVWASGRPASTAELLSRVRALGERDPATYRELLDAQAAAAEQGARAVVQNSAASLVAALGAQTRCLARLGQAAEAPIVTAEVAALHDRAQQQGAVVLPAGAGGGDTALFAGLAPPSDELVRQVAEVGYRRLTGVQLEARGVHAPDQGKGT